MRPLLYRLLKLVHPRWGWFIFGLVIMLVISVPIITLTGYATSTSTSFICLTCHSTVEAAYVPEEKIITEEEQCIEPTQYMRDKHMDLLNDWKESVVRQGARTYVASDGQEYNMSLTGTCLVVCHSNKAEFCDECHSYVGTKYVRLTPDCWDCHNLPEGD